MERGIDVSSHNGDINWKKVKESGINFAMIRTGYGISNKSQIDKKFYNNIEAAINEGINVGVYHYSYADSPLDASREAAFCLDIIKDYKLSYPIAYDIEDPTISKYTKQEKTDMCKSFCDKIEAAGYYAMIYCNKNWLNNHLYSHELLPYYDLWFAQWGAQIPDVSCGIWQKSSTGNVPGISTNVDINISFKDYPSILKKAHLNNLDEPSNDLEYKVCEGDSLWRISEKYYGIGAMWGEIMKYNNLKSNVIYPGQILKIPNKTK